MATLCTVLPVAERPRVEAAGDGCFRVLHCDTLGAAAAAARTRPIDALLVSGGAYGAQEGARLAQFAQAFPAVTPIALLSPRDPWRTERLLQLGAAGVRAAVDAADPAAWRELRALVARAASPCTMQILARLVSALGAPGDEVRAFFDVLARLAPTLPTVRRLAEHFGVSGRALASRFRRAALPSPKTYLAGMRVLHAAHLYSHAAVSLADVAERLAYGSAVVLRFHVRQMLGVPPGAFRGRLPFPLVLERYVDRLITPYRETLCAFHPLPSAGWPGSRTQHHGRVPGGGLNRPRRAPQGAPVASVLV